MSDPFFPMGRPGSSTWPIADDWTRALREDSDALATTGSFVRVAIPAQNVPQAHEAFARFCQNVTKPWSVLHPGSPFKEAQLTTLEELRIETDYKGMVQPMRKAWQGHTHNVITPSPAKSARQVLMGMAQASVSQGPPVKLVQHSVASVLMLLLASWSPSSQPLAALCGPSSNAAQVLSRMQSLDRALVDLWSGATQGSRNDADCAYALIQALKSLAEPMFAALQEEPIADTARRWANNPEQALNCALQLRLTKDEKDGKWLMSLVPCGWGMHHALTFQPTWQEGPASELGARLALRIVDKADAIVRMPLGWNLELGIANTLPEVMPAPVALVSLRRAEPMS